MSSTRINRPLLLAAYLVAVSFLLLPLGETVLRVWPLRPGSVAWRFGAAGLFGEVLLTPLLGMLLLVGLALLREQCRVLRLVSLVAGLATLVALAASGLFALDALELRTRVRPEALLGYDAAAVKTIGKLLLALLFNSLLAIGGWRTARRGATKARTRYRREDLSVGGARAGVLVPQARHSV